jgi:hypothetical protein
MGNTISNLSVSSQKKRAGLFCESFGHLLNIGLTNVNINITRAKSSLAGALVADNESEVAGDFATGAVTVTSSKSYAGGLVGVGSGTIEDSYANVAVTISDHGIAGGLAGSFNAISSSFATGHVIGGAYSGLGGLIGGQEEFENIKNSYATGNVQGGDHSVVGGLFAGATEDTISDSYSTGTVTAGSESHIGGFAGSVSSVQFLDCYWNTDTSGTDTGVGFGSDTGVTGLTTAQFQSGLPAGFDPSVWAENSAINNGLPYLIANPPPKK